MSDKLSERLSPMEMQVLTDFRQRVTTALGTRVSAFRLFGSRARGESHEESDIDVLVLTTEIDREIKHTIWDIANDLLLETDIYLSPLVMSVTEFQNLRARERLIALDIEREGIPL